jgi:CRP/FNR family transcriptional regulator
MESCAQCQAPVCISHLSLFKRLSKNQRAKVVNHVIRYTLKKGDVFLNEGDDLAQFIIISRGRFRAVRNSEEGKMKVVQYLKTGDFIGQESLFDKTEIPYTLEAMEPASVCTIPAATMHSLIQSEPEIGFAILSELSAKVNTLEKELATVHLESLEVRLMNLLQQLSQDYGVEEAEGTLLHNPMSQDDMAMRLGVSRESVNRKLKQLEKEERIALLPKKQIYIHKM